MRGALNCGQGVHSFSFVARAVIEIIVYPYRATSLFLTTMRNREVQGLDGNGVKWYLCQCKKMETHRSFEREEDGLSKRIPHRPMLQGE